MIILEIRAGAGGDEASLFAGDLARMYQKYAMRKDGPFQYWTRRSPGQKEYKTLIAEVGGRVYDALRMESGVHRVQRVPVTERQGRIHTSTASVAVLPLVEAKSVGVKESDLEVTFSRAGDREGRMSIRLKPPSAFSISQPVLWFFVPI